MTPTPPASSPTTSPAAAAGAVAARAKATQSGPESGLDTQLAESARALETAFLAEMLKAAEYGRIASGSGSGDESPFDSFMADAQAQAMMARGGIGLASHIERALAAQRGEVSE